MGGVFGQTLNITGFVFVMMLVIEYVNIFTRGLWRNGLARNRWGQYLVAALLGVTPGCLGAFMVVGMYSHCVLSLGAVVTAMIATSGDEAFVMLALIPGQAVLLGLGLLVLGILAGALTDVLAKNRTAGCAGLQIHDDEQCHCFNFRMVLVQLREMSPVRGVLMAALAGLLVAVGTGRIGPGQWNWVRLTIMTLTAVSLGIVGTVPEHFLEQHLWDHVVKQHLPRIFAWTLGTLALMHVLTDTMHLEGLIHESRWAVLVIACLVGLIPESGPHLVFLTLYIQGAVPLSILLASSIVQDGHGMLPMLAYSRRDFVRVKLINLAAGLGVGGLGLSLGF